MTTAATSTKPESKSLLGHAYRRPAAFNGGAADGSSTQSSTQSSTKALSKLADQLTRSIKDVNWIADSDPKDDTSTTTDDDDDTDYASIRDASPAVCSSVEYAGTGENAIAADRMLESRVQVAFSDSKEVLLGWLAQNRHRFPATTLAYLEGQVKTAKLLTGVADQDLQWRGIGVWTRNEATGEATIKLGSGFYTLMKKQPARAKFELTRLIAQTWSPCELEKKKLEQPWSAYLRCMGFTGVGADPSALGCTPGGYSEAGWAVSSAVAVTVTDPGCAIPAFNEPARSECPKSFLLPLMMGAGNDRHLASETQEARK